MTMDQRLTESDYKKLLLNRFNDPDIQFIKADFKPISENTEGFMGQHLKLQLTYSKNNTESTVNFFVKTKPFEMPEGHPAETDVYEKEIFIYDVLLKEFEKLGFDNSFSPKCYLTVNNETLVMEDVHEKNYKLPVRQTFYDTTKIKSLLRSLALLHAGSFCFAKNKQICIVDEYPIEMKEIFFTQYTTGQGFGVQWFNSFISNCKKLINLLPKDESYKNKFKNLLDQAELGKIFVENHNLNKCVIHGDLWSNNMLFNNEDKCCLVDYQSCRYFYPAFDVILATHSNTDQQFRETQLENMYEFYYNTFSEICRTYGQNPEDFMTLQEFRKGLEICKIEALAQVTSINCMIFVPADFLQSNMKKAEEEIKKQENANMEELMKKLQEEFCPIAFENNEIYRNMIINNLYDFYDALEQKYC